MLVFIFSVLCLRLQKEALKQAAVDPATGKIDISILTTGISGEARKQRAARAKLMKEVIRAKGKVVTLKVAKIFEEFKEKLIEKGEKVCCTRLRKEKSVNFRRNRYIVIQ